eukprot:2305754-Prymnesium_polylepis.1
MMKRNRFLHDLKLCQAQAKEAKANGAEMLVRAAGLTRTACLNGAQWPRGRRGLGSACKSVP